MTDPSSALDPDEIHERLPESWRVKEDTLSAVYGFADGDAAVDFPDLPQAPASFAVRKQTDSELWEAVWKGPHDLGDDIEELAERVSGSQERCVEWVLEKAESLEGTGE